MFFIAVNIISVVMVVVLGLLFIRPLTCNRWAKAAYFLLCVVICFKIQLLYLADGESFFTPKLSPAIVIPGNWAWMVFFFYTPVLILLSLGLFLSRLCIPALRRIDKTTWQRRGNIIRLSTLGVMMLICTIGTYNALQQPEVEEITLELPSLPTGTPPVRLALLADLHADSIADADFMQGVVQRTNAAKPDIIAIAGDFVDGSVAHFGEHLAPLRHLHAPMGVYGVEGNHDLYSGYEEWRHFLENIGIRMLDNEGVALHSGSIWLAGVRDEATKHFYPHQLHPDAVKALYPAPADSAKILLAHQPATFNKPEHAGADLQLSGHTHGGMMPGVRALIARANGGYVAGLYQNGARHIYVSRGTRLWSGWLFRLANPAEITLITLKPKAA